MNVNGVTAAVYVSPQLLAPLVPSKEAIAMLLAARPDLNEATAHQALATHQPAPAVSSGDDPGGHVDVYA